MKGRDWQAFLLGCLFASIIGLVVRVRVRGESSGNEGVFEKEGSS